MLFKKFSALLSKELRDRMYHTLRNVFGFRGFRFCQQAVVVASLLGHNSCVLMPTGWFLRNFDFVSAGVKFLSLPIKRK